MRASSSTKEQVLLNLGEPDRTLNNGKVFLYVWKMVVAEVVGAYGGGGPIPITYLLLIEFDENNVVGRSEIRKGFFVLQAVLDEMEAR